MKYFYSFLVFILAFNSFSFSQNVRQVKWLTAPDAAHHDNLGGSVSMSGDYVIVGAQLEDPGGVSDAGAAYIYYMNQGGANNWGFVKKLTAPSPVALDYYGYSVSISGDYAVVGAYQR